MSQSLAKAALKVVFSVSIVMFRTSLNFRWDSMSMDMLSREMRFSRFETIRLKDDVSSPISSFDFISTVRVRSPLATRFTVWVSRLKGDANFFSIIDSPRKKNTSISAAPANATYQTSRRTGA